MSKKISIPMAILALAAFGPASAASAKDTDVRRAGSCSGASSSKIKLSPENGRIEVEFEVDQNRNNRAWNWAINDNDVRMASGQARTAPPSGSFEVRRLIPNRPGPDRVVAGAKNPASGELCIARATL